MLFVIAAGIVSLAVCTIIGVLVIQSANALLGKTIAAILFACWGAWALWQWWKGKKASYQERATENEIEWLEELADEHERGTRDNREKLQRMLTVFEKENKDPWLYKRRLDNIRRIIG